MAVPVSMQNAVTETRFIAAGNRLTAPFRRYIYGEPYKLKLADNATPTEALDFLKFAASKKTGVPSALQEKAVDMLLKGTNPNHMIKIGSSGISYIPPYTPKEEPLLEALLSGAIDYAPAQLKIAQNLWSIEAVSEAQNCPYLTSPAARQKLERYSDLMNTLANFWVKGQIAGPDTWFNPSLFLTVGRGTGNVFAPTEILDRQGCIIAVRSRGGQTFKVGNGGQLPTVEELASKVKELMALLERRLRNMPKMGEGGVFPYIKAIDAGGTGAAPIYPINIKLSQGAEKSVRATIVFLDQKPILVFDSKGYVVAVMNERGQRFVVGKGGVLPDIKDTNQLKEE